MTRFSQAITVLGMALLLAGTAHATAPRPGIDRSPFGAQSVWPVNAHLETYLDRMVEAGIEWGRFDLMWWSLAEAQPGVFNFTNPPFDGWQGWNTDRAIQLMRDRDIEPFPILCYGNSLYDNVRTSDPPAWREAFGNYCYEAVSRYRDSVTYWEVWNEPNLEFFWGAPPDPVEYTEMTRVAAARIREANPDAVVVGAAIAGTNGFLRTAIEEGLLEVVDAITVHPYRVATPESFTSDLHQIRNTIAQHSDRYIPVWTGEWGYNTFWSEVTPLGQAKCLSRMMLNNLMHGVELSIWFSTHAFQEIGDGNDPEWGLLDYQLERRPSFYAMQVLNELMPAPVQAVDDPFSTTVSGGSQPHRLAIFQRGEQPLYIMALWDIIWPVTNDSFAGRQVNVSIDIAYDATIAAHDGLTGNTVPIGIEKQGNTLVLTNVPVRDYPVLIEIELIEPPAVPEGWQIY